LRWEGHVAHMEEGSVYRVLVEIPKGERRPRHRWEVNINWTLGR